MNAIEKRRLRLGFTQEELAEIVSVDRTTIGKWEMGKSVPRIKHVIALSKALDCSIDDILHVIYLQH